MHKMEECYFSKINKCRCSESSDYATAGPQRIQTVINCSKKYDDNLHQDLQDEWTDIQKSGRLCRKVGRSGRCFMEGLMVV